MAAAWRAGPRPTRPRRRAPATTDNAFGSDRSRPSGVDDAPEREPRMERQRDRQEPVAQPERAGTRRPEAQAARRAPRSAVTGHETNAASPYRATTITWSKIIGIGARRAPGDRARLILRHLPRTPALPCSTIYRNGCRASSRRCAAKRGSPTTTSRTRCARCASRCSRPTSRCRSSRTSSRRCKDKAVGEEVIGSLTPGQALIGVVHRELAALMGGARRAARFRRAAAGGDPARRTAGRRQDHDGRQARAPAARAEEEGAAGVGRRLPSRGDRAARRARRRRSASDVFPSTSGEKPVAIAEARARLGEAALPRRADRRHRGPARDRRGDDARDRASCMPR